jgi:hypothetical protein
MADMDSDRAQQGVSDPDTWAELKEAAGKWTHSMLADQIQRIGPSLREAMHPDQVGASERDLLPDFEAEP